MMPFPTRLLALLLCVMISFCARAESFDEARMRAHLTAHPDDLETRFALARALSWAQRYDEALVEYRRLLKSKPQNADFLLGMAQVKLWQGKPEAALPLLRTAKQLAPGYADIWHLQIQALLALGDQKRLRQAKIIRDEARRRFGDRQWSYARLDSPSDPASPPPVPGRDDSYSDGQTIGNAPTPPPVSSSPQLDEPGKAAQPDSGAKQRHFAWEAGLSYFSLSRQLPPWRQQHLTVEWQSGSFNKVYAGVRETERYHLRDREAHLGLVLPLTSKTQIQIEAGASASHRVLPKHYGAVRWLYQPADGWSLGAGWRHSNYETGSSRIIDLGIDRYLGSERFSYTLFAGGPVNSPLATSHRLQWAHYYGEADWIGLGVLRGKEAEYASGSGLLTSKVSGLAISGQHAIAEGWAVVWNAERHRQGDLYTRTGIHLALRHAF